jgi:hypothetical protein
MIEMDTTDFKILKAISDMKVAYPRASKINSIVNLDLEELGARLGVLELEGYIKTQSEAQLDAIAVPTEYAPQG